MSLQDNTLDLQAILAAVNALPEAGGGGSQIVTGSFTPTEDIDCPTLSPNDTARIDHNCGFVPRLFLVWTTSYNSLPNYGLCVYLIVRDAALYDISYGTKGNNHRYQFGKESHYGDAGFVPLGEPLTDTTAYLTSVNLVPAILQAGTVYNWIAVE